jgi:hypothetical protein
VVTVALKPNAAMPPARKFRRAALGGSAVAAQQAQARKCPFHAVFCDADRGLIRLAFIPILAFCFVVDQRELSGAREFGKRASVSQKLAALPTRVATADRDEALKFFLQNLLDSRLIAFIWERCRYWSVYVD